MNNYLFQLLKQSVKLILIFGCLILSVNAQKDSRDTKQEIKTISYCEVKENPDIYNNKTIRVHGIYERGFEVSAFYDETCSDDSQKYLEGTWIWDFRSQNNCSDSKTNEILKTFKSEGDQLEVTLIGIFNGSKDYGGFGHLNGYKYQIKVSCIEQAKLLPVEKYGCKRVDETKPFHYISFVKMERGVAP